MPSVTCSFSRTKSKMFANCVAQTERLNVELQSWPKKFVLGCVSQQAESRNLGQTFLTVSVRTSTVAVLPAAPIVKAGYLSWVWLRRIKAEIRPVDFDFSLRRISGLVHHRMKLTSRETQTWTKVSSHQSSHLLLHSRALLLLLIFLLLLQRSPPQPDDDELHLGAQHRRGDGGSGFGRSRLR